MSKTTTMTIRVTHEVKAKLEHLARDTKRSKSYLAGEAVASYVEHNAWQAEQIRQAVEDADRPDSLWVTHEEAMDWFESLGTDSPLPKPRGRRKSEL